MKHKNNFLMIKLYFLATIFVFICWIPFPETCHFMGASSLVYAFLLAVGCEQRFLSILVASWIPILFINLVIWFVFALKKHKSFPFLVVVGADLLVSLLIICYKVYSSNSTDLGITILGFTIRMVYFGGMIQSMAKSKG